MLTNSASNVPAEVRNFTMPNHEPLSEICAPLWKSSLISYFTYARIFDDGFCIDLTTSDDKTTPISASKEWILYFYQNRMHEKIAGRMKLGINYLRKLEKEISQSETLSTQLFDIGNKLDLVRRGNGYFDQFCFGCSSKNFDQVSHFYIYHQDELLKFASYFQSAAEKIILDAYSHKIELPNYITPTYKLERKYHKELQAERHKLSLTAKEFVYLLLYANGCNRQQMAEMMNVTIKSVDYHISEIKSKNNISTRKDANVIVREHGWQDLVGFFFNYIPKAKHKVKHKFN
ncbi:response regulator transcription factor [Fastidiosibacter lacustris]|uniref:response regulator transcription factor n=1 Tax=Fastidiosibacter lacustris TaxID=2056695 RepID=UPI000E343B9F|nr:LuxR C-terminal-related transcriptional regulator [Fastidiosibacter lacustris]